jgi:hypothetical protein
MATLILSTVGAIYGGPVGGAIGAFVGQKIDQLIIGNGKSREGPRLKELQLQTSSYGTQIPAILGSMRVAGTVIWSTDLIEKRKKSGGSKTQPSTINYSYSASFAVALSSHPVARVRRIWADGNLLRGSAGDFKTPTVFRFYEGHADQSVDPLIASALGAVACPAFRGIAYAVFEDMQLADYGNRIPSLTFELFERETPVSLSTIAAVSSVGAISGTSAETVTGYAVQGSDVETAMRPLVDNMPVFMRPNGDGLQLVDWFGDAGVNYDPLPVAAINGREVERPARSRQPDDKLPAAIAIRYFDPLRDYQAGTQQSQFLRGGQDIPVLELPAANGSAQTKRFAELALLQMHRARDGLSLHALSSSASTQIGDRLGPPHYGYRITEIEKFLGWERIEAKGWLTAEPDFNGITESGTVVSPPDAPIGETSLILVDLPNLAPTDANAPQLFVAAAGNGSGWRSASLSIRDGDNLVELGGTNQAAVMGTLLTPLLAHQPLFVDQRNRPVVRLLNGAMELPSGDDNPLSRSAPALSLNGEILRFGRAEYLGGADYRLHGLIRGVGGTEHNIADHPAGTAALLLDPASLTSIDPSFAVPNSILKVEGLGIGDANPASAEILVERNAVRPLSPVHGQALRGADGGFALRWIRRNRADPGWIDGVDMPMSEDQLQFDITLKIAGENVRSWTVFTENFLLSAVELASMSISVSSMLNFEIRQVGRYAQSRPLHIVMES